MYTLIRQYNFADIVVVDGNTTHCTHVPMILSEDGTKLVGHVSRENPVGKVLLSSPLPSSLGEMLCIFRGPHAYISPTYYKSQQMVPTWNYAAVHVRGTARPVESDIESLNVLEQLSEFHEKALVQLDGREPWSMKTSISSSKVEAMLRLIVSFAVDITSMEGQWKLSQNRNPADYNSVIEHLQMHPDGSDAQGVAQMMASTPK
jgi:transcriptional regulator